MEIIQKIKIDLLKPGVRPVVNVMQSDVNSRVIEIALYANSVAWEIPDGASFSVAYKKPDGTSGLYDTLPDGTSASFAKGNVLSIRLAPQMLTVPGDVASSVAIFSSDQKISTFPVVVNVVQNPAAGATESEDYYWISTLAAIGNMDDLKTKEKSSLVAAINEIFSTGTAGGYYTPVVTQPTTNTMKTAFVPSVATMPAVEPVTITLPGSDSGQDKTGGFVVQDTAPEDTSVLWIDTSDNGFDSPPNSGDYLPRPSTASVGQYIVVSAVDEGGKVTAVEATDAPTLPSAEGVAF